MVMTREYTGPDLGDVEKYQKDPNNTFYVPEGMHRFYRNSEGIEISAKRLPVGTVTLPKGVISFHYQPFKLADLFPAMRVIFHVPYQWDNTVVRLTDSELDKVVESLRYVFANEGYLVFFYENKRLSKEEKEAEWQRFRETMAQPKEKSLASRLLADPERMARVNAELEEHKKRMETGSPNEDDKRFGNPMVKAIYELHWETTEKEGGK